MHHLPVSTQNSSPAVPKLNNPITLFHNQLGNAQQQQMKRQSAIDDQIFAKLQLPKFNDRQIRNTFSNPRNIQEISQMKLKKDDIDKSALFSKSGKKEFQENLALQFKDLRAKDSGNTMLDIVMAKVSIGQQFNGQGRRDQDSNFNNYPNNVNQYQAAQQDYNSYQQRQEGNINLIRHQGRNPITLYKDIDNENMRVSESAFIDVLSTIYGIFGEKDSEELVFMMLENSCENSICKKDAKILLNHILMSGGGGPQRKSNIWKENLLRTWLENLDKKSNKFKNSPVNVNGKQLDNLKSDNLVTLRKNFGQIIEVDEKSASESVLMNNFITDNIQKQLIKSLLDCIFVKSTSPDQLISKQQYYRECNILEVNNSNNIGVVQLISEVKNRKINEKYNESLDCARNDDHLEENNRIIDFLKIILPCSYFFEKLLYKEYLVQTSQQSIQYRKQQKLQSLRHIERVFENVKSASRFTKQQNVVSLQELHMRNIPSEERKQPQIKIIEKAPLVQQIKIQSNQEIAQPKQAIQNNSVSFQIFTEDLMRNKNADISKDDDLEDNRRIGEPEKDMINGTIHQIELQNAFSKYSQELFEQKMQKIFIDSQCDNQANSDKVGMRKKQIRKSTFKKGGPDKNIRKNINDSDFSDPKISQQNGTPKIYHRDFQSNQASKGLSMKKGDANSSSKSLSDESISEFQDFEEGDHFIVNDASPPQNINLVKIKKSDKIESNKIMEEQLNMINVSDEFQEDELKLNTIFPFTVKSNFCKLRDENLEASYKLNQSQNSCNSEFDLTLRSQIQAKLRDFILGQEKKQERLDFSNSREISINDISPFQSMGGSPQSKNLQSSQQIQFQPQFINENLFQRNNILPISDFPIFYRPLQQAKNILVNQGSNLLGIPLPSERVQLRPIQTPNPLQRELGVNNINSYAGIHQGTSSGFLFGESRALQGLRGAFTPNNRLFQQQSPQIRNNNFDFSNIRHSDVRQRLGSNNEEERDLQENNNCFDISCNAQYSVSKDHQLRRYLNDYSSGNAITQKFSASEIFQKQLFQNSSVKDGYLQQNQFYEKAYFEVLQQRSETSKKILRNEGKIWEIYIQNPNKQKKNILHLRLMGPDIVVFPMQKQDKPIFMVNLPNCEISLVNNVQTSADKEFEIIQDSIANIGNREDDFEQRCSAIDKARKLSSLNNYQITVKVNDRYKRVFYLSDEFQARSLFKLMKEAQKFWKDKLSVDPKERYKIGERDRVKGDVVDETQYLIGEGAYGKVYRAFDNLTNKEIALKKIEKSTISKEDLISLHEEIEIQQILSQKTHPKFLKIYDYFEDDNHFFILMELFNGESLFDWLIDQLKMNRSTQERMSTAKIVFEQLCQALASLFNNGIVHRDIKLDNILINKDTLETKIIDFGLSTILLQGEYSSSFLGTVAFLSPEIVSRKNHSFQTDVWSLGIVLYALVTGHMPFIGKTIEQTITNICEKEINYNQGCWAGVIAPIKDLVSQMLLKDPAKRIKIQDTLNHEWFKQNNE